MINLVRKIMSESSVDFPKEGLNPDFWEEINGEWVLLRPVKASIQKRIEEYPDKDLMAIADEIHVIGSLTTNTYHDDADLDVHIVPKESERSAELQAAVKKWTWKNPLEISGHPIEIFIQNEPKQDTFNGSAYDFINDKWLAGPDEKSLDYNPYKLYAGVMDKVKALASKADVKMGELKRDAIDYKEIKTAMSQLPTQYKTELMDQLKKVVADMEQEIEGLAKDKDEWTKMRRQSSKITPGDALSDVETVKKWNDANATVKFLDRYQYYRIIGELEDMLDDEKLSDKEVELIGKLMSGAAK